MNTFKPLTFSIISITGIAIGLILLLTNQNPNNPQTFHHSYFSDISFYETSFNSAKQQTPESKKVFGGILPHHLLPSNIIAEFYNKLSSQDIETVVLIGPNHYNIGNRNLLTSKAIWTTPYGELNPNTALIDELINNSQVGVEESAFENEHSISAHTAFIKKTWPNANFVPIILKYNSSSEETAKLADKLDKFLSQKTLVLASVDFSHYQPPWISDFHDKLSENVIEQFDFERIYKLEIDSPPSINTLLHYLAKRGAKQAIAFAHTNSFQLLKNLKNEENTSHFFKYFLESDIKPEPMISLMFIPNIEANTPETLDKFLKSLEGVEGQFFRGTDQIFATLKNTPENNEDLTNIEKISKKHNVTLMVYQIELMEKNTHILIRETGKQPLKTANLSPPIENIDRTITLKNFTDTSTVKLALGITITPTKTEYFPIPYTITDNKAKLLNEKQYTEFLSNFESSGNSTSFDKMIEIKP